MNSRTLTPPVIPPHPSSPNGNWLVGFPLRTFLELGAYPNASGSARGHARNVLAEWRLGHLSEAVSLVASELVTNSVAAISEAHWEAGLPPVRLWVLGGTGFGGHSLGGHGVSGHEVGGHTTGRHSLGVRGAGGHDADGHSTGGHDADGHSTGGHGEVMLLVWDAVAKIPAEPGTPPGELAESGRGLWIVRAYSTGWDFYRPRWEHGGKVARALIDRPQPD